MRAMRIALMSILVVAGCGGAALAQMENYTPNVEQENGVTTRCSIEFVSMIGKDRRKNDLAFKISSIVDAKASPAMVYFSISGQRLARSVERLEITQASVTTATAKMSGNVVKPAENGIYSIGTAGEEALTLPLAMAGGSSVTLMLDDERDPITLTLPPASEATRQQLFSCYQHATGLPESVRPELPGAAAAQ